VRLFDISLPAPYGYYIVGPKSNAAQPKIVRFRNWLLAEAEADARALATTPR
jgi:LysR family glycine cleavage system transcriptional activator